MKPRPPQAIRRARFFVRSSSLFWASQTSRAPPSSSSKEGFHHERGSSREGLRKGWTHYVGYLTYFLTIISSRLPLLLLPPPPLLPLPLPLPLPPPPLLSPPIIAYRLRSPPSTRIPDPNITHHYPRYNAPGCKGFAVLHGLEVRARARVRVRARVRAMVRVLSLSLPLLLPRSRSHSCSHSYSRSHSHSHDRELPSLLTQP